MIGGTNPANIRLLGLDEVFLLADHSLRCMATSGMPRTPIFIPYSRHDLPTRDHLIERYHRDWLIPIGGPGWSRCFGLFDKDGSVRGEAGIRSMKLPSQMHRAEIWIGLESEFRGQGLGEKLLRHLIEWAALSTTLAWIDLGVFAENYGARRLYQQLGFKETGRTVDMFRVDQVRIDNIAMVFDLNQYRLELS